MWSDRESSVDGLTDVVGGQSDRSGRARDQLSSRAGERWGRADDRDVGGDRGGRGRRSAAPRPPTDPMRYSDLLRHGEQVGRPIKVWN